jgi:hypothetical protein
MNPADPKINHALREIEAVYAGQEASHAYYDPAKKCTSWWSAATKPGRTTTRSRPSTP